jgi:NADH-quinone oxidoreductase subunit K
MKILLTNTLPTPELSLFQTGVELSQEHTLLTFCGILYLVGLLGIVFNHKNFLVTMMCAELMYLGVISSFALFGALTGLVDAQIYALVLLILAACESAIGLGLLIALYRFGRVVDFESYQQLGG